MNAQVAGSEAHKKRKSKEDTNPLPLAHNFQGLCLGQDHFLTLFQQSIESGKIPNSWLFTGPFGIGKRTLCYALACKIFGYKGTFSGSDIQTLQQSVLFKQLTVVGHPDLLVFSSPVYLDQIRDLHQRLSYTSLSSSWKIVTFLDIHHMRPECLHALLKVIEEPGQRTLFLLTSAHKNLPPTIISRCCYHTLSPFSQESFNNHLPQILQFKSLAIPENASLQDLFFFSQGRLGRAIQLLENDSLEQFKILWKGLDNIWDHKKICALSEILQIFTGNLPFFEEIFSFWIFGKRQTSFQDKDRFLTLDLIWEKVSTWLKTAQTYHVDTDFIICKSLSYIAHLSCP